MNSGSRQSLHRFDFKTSTPIVQLVDEVIDRAGKCNASDIHIDPRADDVRIRFRIDGVLHDVCAMSRSLHGEFVARIKIMSGLRIDERIVPQDGRLTVGEVMDVRVTVIASYYGESIIMRLLRRTKSVQTLLELGFNHDAEQAIDKVLHARQGLVLVTGPTGSGKTTTLYSLLALVDDPCLSTVTIEDPVEYAMSHARQIQVQQKRGINFANGLRSILRQDPDVIMVGEIRDHETAAIATSAALTGHLVLSTLHTNDALSTVVRCIEMGIEPYLVAATLRLVISQRLVRKLCRDCLKPVQISQIELAMIQKYDAENIHQTLTTQPTDDTRPLAYAARGCEKCNGTGYAGRTVVSEILPITEKIRDMIIDKKPMHSHSLLLGAETIRHQAVSKYLDGLTSFDELIKILPD